MHVLTVGSFEIMFVEGDKRNRMKIVQVEVLILSPFLSRLGTLSEQSEEKLEES